MDGLQVALIFTLFVYQKATKKMHKRPEFICESLFLLMRLFHFLLGKKQTIHIFLLNTVQAGSKF